MTDIWLNISKTIDQEELNLFKDLIKVLNSLGDIKYLLIGAWARNYILQKYNYIASRQTLDIDFALLIENWEQFEVLSESLINSGWRKSSIHTFKNLNGYQVDLIPFGKIASDNFLEWPPDNNPILDTTGFQEALKSAVYVQLSNDLIIPIASYHGLVILKIISWNDRNISLRKKDANDLYHLFKFSSDFYFQECYNRNSLLEKYDFHTDLVAAHLLGEDISIQFGVTIREKLNFILNLNMSILFEMIEHENDDNVDAQVLIMSSFLEGLNF